MQLRRPISGLLLLLLVGALGASPVAAQEPPLDETALVDQYKETIPTASGPKLSGGGGGGGAPLPPALVEDLRATVGEEDAQRLEEVATSPRFGAPLHAPDEGAFPVDDEGPNPLSAAVEALTDEGGGSLLPLLLALVFSTGALFGAAFHRRRQRTA